MNKMQKFSTNISASQEMLKEVPQVEGKLHQVIIGRRNDKNEHMSIFSITA